MSKRKLLMVIFPCILVFNARCQKSVLFEIGSSYITSNIDDEQTRLYDFLALTINPRVLLMQGNNYSFSLEVPLSIRTKSKDDRTTRFGLLLPVMGMLNYGAGSVSEPNKNALGVTAGLGWGYFYQRTQSEINETPQYKESLSSSGPVMQAGLRIPHRGVTLFKYNDKPIYPVSVIKFSYLVNLSESQKNIGVLSLLIGLGF
jgi:hypothetical protein